MNKSFASYSGNSTYCYSNSLRMCLEQAGMDHLPDTGLIECMTGMPFGATFLQFENPLFFPNPTPIDPDSGVTRALESLGWTCELWRSDDADAADAKLREALRQGPVLLGPLDMGFLPYDPNRQHKRGGDHFVVALKLDGEVVQVHDPQLYPFAILPLDDLIRALYAMDLGYAKQAYTLRFNFQPQRRDTREKMLDAALQNARELIHAHPAGPVAYGGPNAFTRVAELLRQNPSDDFTGMLVHFALSLGARRSADAACFLEEVGETEAASLFITRAETFGKAQYYGAQQKWDDVAGLFDDLAQMEAEIAARL
ncbi:MAG: hypothetical protein MHPDNHAH_01156 [Anaerolineales bacterium]|nr:hypothetical protein [Anaerolineales bacterium]